VEQATGTGQLGLRRWQDAYLRDDQFDQDAIVPPFEPSLINEPSTRCCSSKVLQSGAAAGYLLTRFVSEAALKKAQMRRC
jgi:hypothetical protein